MQSRPHNRTETLPRPDVDTGVRKRQRSDFAPLWQILILNDDVTPFGYVILLLEDVFELSLEMAEHVAWTAHSKGSAVVRICPKPEAEKLVARAHTKAKRDGFPLAFDIQPE